MPRVSALLIRPGSLSSKCTLYILPGDDAAGILQTNFFCATWLPAGSSAGDRKNGRQERGQGLAPSCWWLFRQPHPSNGLSPWQQYLVPGTAGRFPASSHTPQLSYLFPSRGGAWAVAKRPAPRSLLPAPHSPSSMLLRPSLSS